MQPCGTFLKEHELIKAIALKIELHENYPTKLRNKLDSTVTLSGGGN
ncbi:MAG: hypothetical protein HC764_19485 [Pleurocapsa sp. CRU_1_2]|nr:hypothetical protein [Pleurocapsa sp. CRU_1_2]